MQTDSGIALTTNIADLRGVGPRRAQAFRSLGIRCVADLLRHLPVRYEHEAPEQPIEGADRGSGSVSARPGHATVRGEVSNVRLVRGRRSRFEATLVDASGTLLLTWFNTPWLKGKIHPGMHLRVTGKTQRFGDYLQMVNPEWELLDDESNIAPRAAGERPVYPASELLTSRVIAGVVAGVLEPAVELIDEHLPEDFRRARELPLLAEAYRTIHQPPTPDAALAARRRLAYDELLFLQLGVMLKRRHRRRSLRAPALSHSAAVDKHITTRFPFELTASQRLVIDEIVRDVITTLPMNRLLQGDVGSGKTVVALYAMLMAVTAGHQAALMAPTELLAEQHHASISAMLEGSSVDIALLTGSLKTRARREMEERLAAGAIDLLIGTHALLTQRVAFDQLGLIVIDEQHRFGVHQRATLRSKSSEPASTPHTLVMTATPIPRTLSLTVFGDLDISTIDQLPPGRQPVQTLHLPAARAAEAYELVAERLRGGEQAYVVVPVIDESEHGLKDITTHAAELSAGPLAAHRVAMMHGRLATEERDAIMRRFHAGEIDALVATTVIEVGVDVPNASVMVIEQADRFGLAQLHQLRGRVGRGARQSTCILVADPVTDEGRARLAAILETNDGFVIAERDLEIRGPGELFGARQSGSAPFHAAILPRDAELLRLARRDAAAWIEENPTLSGERDALLKKRLLKAYGATLGLGDVG